MSFQLQVIDGDKYHVVLQDEPAYIHSLMMAPEAIEPELASENWLIVAFPVWSTPARHSVIAAIACAKQYGGKLHLGVRPYESSNEMSTWWPDKTICNNETFVTVADSDRNIVNITTDPMANPVWLVLANGLTVYQGTGPRDIEQLHDIVHRILKLLESKSTADIRTEYVP